MDSAPVKSTSFGDLDCVGVTLEGSFDDQLIIRNGPCTGGMSRDVRRCKSTSYARQPNIVDPTGSFESSRGPASIQELELRRIELLRGYNEIELQIEELLQKKQEIHDQLSVYALDDAEVCSDHELGLVAKVYVNGQAISRRMIKKAKKIAGPIQPGEYWYDYKVGFWGVMGGGCLGIIPPLIRVFSSPMSENCSKGDSAIFVNGRELTKDDLCLLSARGFPTTKNKRYVVYISGQVLEDETEDFIVNLGRLAPTVEKRMRGFGMHIPDTRVD